MSVKKQDKRVGRDKELKEGKGECAKRSKEEKELKEYNCEFN